MKEVTIYSDGSARGTHIIDDDGNEIRDIAGVSIYIESGDIVRATFDLLAPAMSVKAFVNEIDLMCPFCNATETHKCEKEIGESGD